VLTVDNVTKDYDTGGEPVRALKGVTLQAAAGEFVALMGKSGCGKSTLLNIAGAMDVPTSGRVLLDDMDVASLGEQGLTRLRREKVGFVFQSFQLMHTLTVLENVELPLLLAGRTDRARALEKLRATGMEEFATRYPHQLSGGQMQRVAIARALVNEPRLILADEPTGNLDTATGIAILDTLRAIAVGGTTVLMATHSAEAAAIATRVVRMRDGRIEEMRTN
jgi:ABC-type lipoprotein export system ATPase subunit